MIEARASTMGKTIEIGVKPRGANSSAAFEKRGAPKATIGTAFIYNCMSWGAPEYVAIDGAKRWRSSGFGFGGPEPIEVSSLAVAERIAALLNSGKYPAWLAALKQRDHVEFVRCEVARRNRCIAGAARAKVAMRRRIAEARRTSWPALRSVLVRTACNFGAEARSFQATAARCDAWLKSHGARHLAA